LINGKAARAMLYIICMIPKAVPVIFFFTTSGIEGTMQFPYKEYPIPIKTKPEIDPVSVRPP
jgi:hypothetical protein